MGRARIGRLVTELRMRRRRLDVYRSSPPWPGKDHALRSELIRYDDLLIVASRMLEFPSPIDPLGGPLEAGPRAVLEDRLAVAGVDVLSGNGSTGDVLGDADLTI